MTKFMIFLGFFSLNYIYFVSPTFKDNMFAQIHSFSSDILCIFIDNAMVLTSKNMIGYKLSLHLECHSSMT